jgi:hypothetical protein
MQECFLINSLLQNKILTIRPGEDPGLIILSSHLLPSKNYALSVFFTVLLHFS